jgi:hypothetical protein
MKTDYEITLTRDGHVGLLHLDRPPHNHVTVDLMRNLADALDDFDTEPDVRAIVLTTEGKNFCAGADLNAPGDANIVSPGAGPGINALYVEAVRLFAAKKPIVAAVQGAAVGAGLGRAGRRFPRRGAGGALHRELRQARIPSGLRHYAHPAAPDRSAARGADVPDGAADQGGGGAGLGIGR